MTAAYRRGVIRLAGTHGPMLHPASRRTGLGRSRPARASRHRGSPNVSIHRPPFLEEVSLPTLEEVSTLPATAGPTEVETSHGRALVYVHPVETPRGLLVLGHGAGGGVDAPDLVAVTETANDVGFIVGLVLQPYRVLGRKAPPRAPALDAAWTDVVGALRQDATGLPLVVGGRSAGARVACRTAAATSAVGALCLAFPVRPPGRPDAPSRLPELDGARVPVLVVQGKRDPYGIPPEGWQRTVVMVDGDHSLRAGLPAVRTAARTWLSRLLTSDPWA